MYQPLNIQKTHVRFRSLLLLLLAITSQFAAAQPSVVGKWFGDDELFSNSSKILEIKNEKLGTLKSGNYTDAVAISTKSGQIIATITAEGEEPQTVVLILEADGRLRMTTDATSSGGLLFRNERDLKFVKPLIGNWTGPEAWGTIEESGWATIRINRGPHRFRLETAKTGLVWSIRFFNSRLVTALAYDPQKDTLSVKSEAPWTLARDKK